MREQEKKAAWSMSVHVLVSECNDPEKCLLERPGDGGVHLKTRATRAGELRLPRRHQQDTRLLPGPGQGLGLAPSQTRRLHACLVRGYCWVLLQWCWRISELQPWPVPVKRTLQFHYTPWQKNLDRTECSLSCKENSFESEASVELYWIPS